MQQGITVELFREPSVSQSEIALAVEGFNMVTSISSAIEIIRDTRELRLGSEKDWINTDKIRWPKFDANINIVLTKKALQNNFDLEQSESDDDLSTSNNIGRALGRLGLRYMSSVLIINTQDPYSTPLTTAHELGHAVGLKSEGENFDGHVHCKSSECLMYSFSKTESVVTTRTPKLFGLYNKKIKSTEYIDNGHTFCDECTHQLGKYLYFLREHKNGKTLPPFSLRAGVPIKSM